MEAGQYARYLEIIRFSTFSEIRIGHPGAFMTFSHFHCNNLYIYFALLCRESFERHGYVMTLIQPVETYMTVRVHGEHGSVCVWQSFPKHVGASPSDDP